jgi:hypothetical protein
MVAKKLVSAKAILDYSMFRNQNGNVGDPTDVEDLFAIPHYLSIFNAAYKKELKGVVLNEGHLPAGTRIVDRLNRLLAKMGVQLQQRGGFNHYRVASAAQGAGVKFDEQELAAFEALFSKANALLA